MRLIEVWQGLIKFESTNSHNYILTPVSHEGKWQVKRLFIKGRLKGLRPFKTYIPPSPLKERGIKGVRLINNPYNLKDYARKRS